MTALKNNKARILLYDIETAPNLVHTWGIYEQTALEVIRPWYILCFAYKWLDEPTTTIVSLPDFKKEYKKDPENDYQLVKRLHELFNEADIVIAHNGNSFDQKKVHARFLVHNFDPPTYYRQIDTLREARKHFRFDSNRLNDLGITLGLGKKVDTGGYSLWQDVMAGDETAWRKMRRYNKQDVVLLEKIYKALRPWITNHPNVSMLAGRVDGCPKCASRHLQKRGIRHNQTTTYQEYQCQSCRGYFRDRIGLKEDKPQFVN
jgi:hypothetical protein